MRKIAVLLMSFVMLLNVMAFGVSAEEPVKVIVNGNEVEFDTDPYIENGRTMVPVRAIFEALGADVEWNEANQTVTATRGYDVLKLEIGSKDMDRNSIVYALDIPATITDSRTYIPLRAVGEAFDCIVNWESDTRIVTVDSRKLPVEYEYVEESVVCETKYEGVTITVNFAYPQIISGKNFADEFTVKRLNEIAKDFTYEVFDYKEYSFSFVDMWGPIMDSFDGYPNVIIDVVTTMYVSEKYETVSFVSIYKDPFFEEMVNTKNLYVDFCSECDSIGNLLGSESSIEDSEIYDDIYNEFTKKHEWIRFGRELFDEHPQNINYFMSGNKLTVLLPDKYARGAGGRNVKSLAIEKEY